MRNYKVLYIQDFLSEITHYIRRSIYFIDFLKGIIRHYILKTSHLIRHHIRHSIFKSHIILYSRPAQCLILRLIRHYTGLQHIIQMSHQFLGSFVESDRALLQIMPYLAGLCNAVPYNAMSRGSISANEPPILGLFWGQ